jgi:hypothetical protein
VSRNGGWSPRWRADTKELFFLALDGTMMASKVSKTPTGLDVSDPVPLFATPLLKAGHHRYAVTRDGNRFLFPIAPPRPSPPFLTVRLNWPEALRK